MILYLLHKKYPPKIEANKVVFLILLVTECYYEGKFPTSSMAAQRLLFKNLQGLGQRVRGIWSGGGQPNPWYERPQYSFTSV